MTCKECEKLFSAYLDNDLDVQKRRCFEDHLAECKKCATEFAEFGKVVALTASLPQIQPSPGFDRTLQMKLDDSDSSKKFSFLFCRRSAAVAGIICLLLAAILGTYTYMTSRRSSQIENEHMQIPIGREVTPMIPSYKGESILTNFVMPVVPDVGNSGSESRDTSTAAWEYLQETRTFVLPFVRGEHAMQDGRDANYVIKPVRLIDASDEMGF